MRLNQQRLFDILNKHDGSDGASKICDLFLTILILSNLVAILLESVPEIGIPYARIFLIFEIISVGIFSVEYCLRLWSAAAPSEIKAGQANSAYATWKSRLSYIFSFTGIIDLLSILPSLISLFAGPFDLRWIRVLRLIRLLKLSHFTPALKDLGAGIKQERYAFGAAIYLFLIALFISSSLMYLAENSVQPDAFSSIPETMWWSLITLTTVGYGDVSPVTPLGKIIGAMTALMGVCAVALLTAIIAAAFANQISSRKDIIEAEITHALRDGKITASELLRIRQLQKQLKLTDLYIDTLIRALSETHHKQQK